MDTTSPYPRYSWIAAGLILLIAVTLASLPDTPLPIHALLQWIGLLAGVGAWVVGIGGLPQTNIQIRSQLRAQSPFVMIIALAFGLRVVAFDTSVPRFVDELHFVAAITRLQETPTLPALTQHGTVAAFTWHFPIMQWITVSIFGANFIGLRFISAIIGTVTVAALGWLGTIAFNRRVGLLAALLLATFPPHMHFSRLGINNIVDPLLGILMVAFLFRAMRTHHAFDFAASSACLGLTAYFYEGGRLFFPPLMLALLAVYLWDKRRQGHAFPWRGSGWLVLTALLTAAPVYITWFAHRLSAIPRFSREQGILTFELANLLDPIRVLLLAPDESWFYSGEMPLLLAPVALFFAIGFLIIVIRAARPGNRPAYLLLMLWIIGVIIGNSLLAYRLYAPRYVVVFPALALTTVLGLDVLSAGLRDPRNGRGVLIALAGVLAIVQVVYYFGEHLPTYNEQNGRFDPITDIMFRMANLPEGTRVNAVINADDLPQNNVDAYLRFIGRDDITFYTVSYYIASERFDSILTDLRPHAFFIAPGQRGIHEHIATTHGIQPDFDTYMAVPMHQRYARYIFQLDDLPAYRN